MRRHKRPEEPPSSDHPAVPVDEGIQQDQPGPGPEASGGASPGEEPAVAGGAVVEPPEHAVQRLTGEIDTLKDRYLRLAAEFDNFKKRMIRERGEVRARAQAEVIANSLDALDDLGRVTSLDASGVSVEDLLSGVQLVERKLLRELENAGLKRVGSVGEDFDPNLHEAIGTRPAASPEDDGTVVEVLQVGYQFGGTLLRPARVHVSMAAQDHDGEEARA